MNHGTNGAVVRLISDARASSAYTAFGFRFLPFPPFGPITQLGASGLNRCVRVSTGAGTSAGTRRQCDPSCRARRARRGDGVAPWPFVRDLRMCGRDSARARRRRGGLDPGARPVRIPRGDWPDGAYGKCVGRRHSSVCIPNAGRVCHQRAVHRRTMAYRRRSECRVSRWVRVLVPCRGRLLQEGQARLSQRAGFPLMVAICAKRNRARILGMGYGGVAF